MSLPTLTKAYVFDVNQRVSYVSVLDAMASIAFGWKNHLFSRAAWSIKYTCDGTTGPTSTSDHTDRMASKANFQTRGATVTDPQSFWVLTNGSGADLLFAFTGASADQAYIAYSPGGLYLPAATPTNKPTASDECIITSGVSVVATAASSDRVWHAISSTDKKCTRLTIFRSNTLVNIYELEEIISTVTTTTWTPPLVGRNTSIQPGAGAVTLSGGSMGAPGGVGGQNGAIARVNSTNIAVGGGGEVFFGTGSPFGVAAPELQAAASLIPLCFASNTANFQGKLGNRIDAWASYYSGSTSGDTFGSLQFVQFGTQVYPWDGLSNPQIA